MKQLEEGQIYLVSGGFFKASFNQERKRWELWTHQGLSGHVIGRTGFEVGDDGRLYDRIFDLEAEEMVISEVAHYTVEDLIEDHQTGNGLAQLSINHRQPA